MFSRGVFIFLSAICFIHCKQREAPSEFSKEKLLRQLDQAIEDQPFNDSLYFLRGNYYYTKSDFKAAQSDLVYAIKLDSLIPEYYHLLADAYLDGGNSFDGLNTMMRAVIQFPTRIPTLLKLCEFQNILKQYDHSLETITMILKQDPTNAQGYLMAGINLRDMKDTANAIKNITTATKYDDHLTDAWIILGQLTQHRDYRLAGTYFKNALLLDSNDLNTLHAYAMYVQSTESSSALHLYQKIIDLDPSYSDAYLNMGILYFRMDSFSRALDHFNILCRQEPTESKYYYYRGTVKEAINDNEGAKSDFEQAIKLNRAFHEAKSALSHLKK